MKKLVALMAALVMLLSFAMAEETAVQAVNFDEMVPVEQQEALGKYDKLIDGFPAMVWVLNDTFNIYDASGVPEELATGFELGIFKYAKDENLFVIFNPIANDGGSFDDLVAALKAEPDNFNTIQEAVINGVRAVSYASALTPGYSFATYAVSDDMWLNIMATDGQDEDFAQALSLLCLSVKAAE